MSQGYLQSWTEVRRLGNCESIEEMGKMLRESDFMVHMMNLISIMLHLK